MTTLEAVLECIVSVAQPDRVVLFGSAARGTAGPHSDLDFLVIKRGITSRRQLAQTIYRALLGIRASAKAGKCMRPEGGGPGDPREWLRRARSNLARSSQGQVTPDMLFEDARFDTQQAGEKAFKALLVLRACKCLGRTPSAN